MAGLILLAGLIAVTGDRVGRSVGRRRLSLFGLRPRHTSVIITVLTGVLIAAASLGLVLLVSTEARLALFRIDEIQRTLRRYQQELERAQASRDEAVALAQEAARRREEAEAALQQARQQLEQVERDLAEARSQLSEAHQRLEQARRELAFQASRVGQLQQLSETLAGRVEDLRAQVASLERTQRELSDAILVLWNTAQRLQYGSVAYQKDEIVLATVIEASHREQAQQELLAFLRQVDAAAAARAHPGGADVGPEGVVRILPAAFDEAVEVLASAPGPWVVRARAQRNTLVGETVPVTLELVPRGLAYHKGQVVAEQVVDADAGPLEDQVLELLRTANEMAIRYGGMVSAPDGTVGKLVSADEFVRAIQQLRQTEGPVRLLAVAAQDTYNTEGPLQIQLKVEHLGGS